MAGILTNNPHAPTDLVSVIMPAYNAAAFISDAIASVVAQTYPAWELIIVDDGSTDDTARIVRKFAAEDKRIRYVYQDNAGQGSARNTGMKTAGGTYVAFLDADDLWVSEKLHLQLSVISSVRVDLVFTEAWVFDKVPVTDRKMDIKPGFHKGPEGIADFFEANYIPILTVLAKKSTIVEAGGFSEVRDHFEDYHLWLRLLIAGHAFFGMNQSLAYYRTHPASSSAGEGKLQFQSIRTLEHIRNEFPQYASLADQSIFKLINTHLTKVNIDTWSVAQRLLEIRNQLPGGKLAVSFWKGIYHVFGKNGFRILFGLGNKSKAKRLPHSSANAAIV
jgi:glycosyltransferase involved in cell wall biosynthesis